MSWNPCDKKNHSRSQNKSYSVNEPLRHGGIVMLSRSLRVWNVVLGVWNVVRGVCSLCWCLTVLSVKLPVWGLVAANCQRMVWNFQDWSGKGCFVIVTSLCRTRFDELLQWVTVMFDHDIMVMFRDSNMFVSSQSDTFAFEVFGLSNLKKLPRLESYSFPQPSAL